MKCTSFKLFGLVIAVSLFCLIPNAVANAKDNSENIISTVSVSKSKMDPTGYELNIDSTKSVQYKSHIEGDRNVYFDLKNSTLAPDMGTIYNDVNNIDNEHQTA